MNRRWSVSKKLLLLLFTNSESLLPYGLKVLVAPVVANVAPVVANVAPVIANVASRCPICCMGAVRCVGPPGDTVFRNLFQILLIL